MHKAWPEYADALVDFSDGDLSVDERRAVAEHVAACAGCRAELTRLDASLERLISGVVSQPVTSRPRAGTSSRLGWVAAVAAAVLLCIGAAWWAGLRRADHPRLAKVDESPHVEIKSAPKLGARDALWQIA